MQRKLIVALVAGALEIYAASASAQAAVSCTSTEGPRPFVVGQLNPVTGYGEYVKDINGLALQICKDPNLCFFDPQVPGNLQSEQTGTGAESFFWLADSVTEDAVTGFELRFVMAAEATYTVEEPTAGEQLTFTRFRVRMNTDQLGRYRIHHPWGTHEVLVEAIDAAGWEVNETFDIAFRPGQTDACGKVGPWLRWTEPGDAGHRPGEAAPPAGYIGDGATFHTVKGGSVRNFVEIEAVALNDETPVNFAVVGGQPSHRIRNDLFTVQGQLWDGDTQAVLASDRVTYRRAAGTNDTRIDAFATSGTDSSVTIKDVTTTVASGTGITTAVALDHSADVFSTARGIGVRSATTALPIGMELVANGKAADGSVGQATRLVRGLTDSVVIQQADYDPSAGVLTVRATSSDATVAQSRLIIEETATAANGAPIVTRVPPGTVTVQSPAGGSDTAPVRVVDAVALQAPTHAAATRQTGSILVTWQDSSNEFGYQIKRYLNGSATATTLPAAIGADVTQFADTGIADDNTYAYRVVAVRGNETAESNLTTPVVVPILAPTITAVRQAAVNPTTSLTVTWSRVSTSLRAYRIYRSDANGLNEVLVGNVAAGQAMTYTDTGLAVNTAYTYRIEVVGNTGNASSATLSGRTASAVNTLSAPASLTATIDPNNANSAILRWTDTATSETGYRITRQRHTHDATTGVFAATATDSVTVNTVNLQTYNRNIGTVASNLARGLANPGVFRYVVTPVNGGTVGDGSTSGFIYNGTVPAPGGVTAGANALTFTQPGGAGNAGIASYVAQYCIGNATTCTANTSNWVNLGSVARTTTASPTIAYTALPAGTNSYRFRVRSATPVEVGANSPWVMSTVRTVTR
ncbi:hypothetical protein ACWA7J_05570 [Leptothrix sp. BB-4]